MNELDYKKRIAAATARGILNAGQNMDLEGYPVDVVEVLAVVCREWNLKPPRTKKSKAYWIQSARELLDACGEFGEELITEYRREFKEYMSNHNGLAPFRVEGPNSLVKSVRALAGERRSEGGNDRQRYISGEYAEFINH